MRLSYRVQRSYSLIPASPYKEGMGSLVVCYENHPLVGELKAHEWLGVTSNDR